MEHRTAILPQVVQQEQTKNQQQQTQDQHQQITELTEIVANLVNDLQTVAISSTPNN